MLYYLVIPQCSIWTNYDLGYPAGFHWHAAVTAATDDVTAATVRVKMSFK